MTNQFLHLQFEGIVATVRMEFITCHLYSLWSDGRKLNMGLVVMGHEEFIALALSPPKSELVKVDVAVTEGTLDGLLETLLGTTARTS